MAEKLLYTRREAAEMLGMSLSHFQRHAQPYLRYVRSGQLCLFPGVDLRRFAEEQARQPRIGR